MRRLLTDMAYAGGSQYKRGHIAFGIPVSANADVVHRAPMAVLPTGALAEIDPKAGGTLISDTGKSG